MAKPPVSLTLAWTSGLSFRAETADGRTVVTDGDTREGLSPVELLAVATAGCMAIDVVHILGKSRVPLEGLRVAFTGARAETEPRRFTSMHLAFDVAGDVPQAQLDRALQLSHDKYCSVWHTLRQDLPLEVTTSIKAHTA